MIKYFSILILVIVSRHCLYCQSVFDKEKMDKKTYKLISKYSKQLQGAGYLEYKVISDLDCDGINDTLILFGVEAIYRSANGTKQFLGIWLSSEANKGIAVKEVGERGSRIIDTVYVQDHDIFLSSRIYGDIDAQCCPSIYDTVIYRIENGEILEVNRK